MLNIRPAVEVDHEAIWKIFHAVAKAGETYAFDPHVSRDDALGYWLHDENHSYIAETRKGIAGSYFLRANQQAPGAHIANAAFMVAPEERGAGIGRAMGKHCLEEARRLGFRAMQFNFVVSTNETAVRLWRELGFAVVGVLPGAFRHPRFGFVDVYVMFRSLIDPSPEA
jgi:GNAT superfamily N-acetyltransferase